MWWAACRPDPGQDMLVPQESEIEAVRWLPLDEYAALPFLKTRPQLMRMAEVGLKPRTHPAVIRA